MKILVTGSSGFLGHHVLEEFYNKSKETIISPGSINCDLTNPNDVDNYFKNTRCDCILHLAAVCGGILANRNSPADFLVKNLQMGINIFEAARKNDIKYVYTLGSVCGYPKYCQVPFKEDNLWNGYPEGTNAPYGHAKRTLLMLQNTYRKQYGIKGTHLIPVNLFGTQDHFDLINSHVIPALIRKFLTAVDEPAPSVELWGSGEVSREFLYAPDCAEAIVKTVLMKLDYPEPINLGTGRDISIRELAETIAKLCGYKGDIVFNTNMPDGQPKRRLDVSRAKEVLGWEAKTSLLEGLTHTITWYEDNRHLTEDSNDKNNQKSS